MKSFSCFSLPGLLVALVFPSGAGAQEASLEDEVGLLYCTQMQFDPNGVPLVTIGIMEEQQRILLSSPDGLELSFHAEVAGPGTQQILRTPPGAVWSFEVGRATPAQVTYWCGVESIPFGKKEILNRSIAAWRDRGETVQVFEGGSVFGIRGHVIDNRTYLLAIRPFDNERQANEAVEEVFNRYGAKTFIHQQLSRRPSGTIRVFDAASRQVQTALDLVRVHSVGSHPIAVSRVEYGKGYRWHGYQDRQFAGTLLITLDRNGLLVLVNQIAVDRLLEGLVPSEIYPNAPMEALKAQAVVARGEVLAKIGTRHFLDPFLLCASTHCQLYAGVGAEQERTSQAVVATRGELVFLGPHLVDSVYSASCGGHTEDNENVWSDPPSPALRGKPDMRAEASKMWSPVGEKLSQWLNSYPAAFCQLSTFNRKGIFRWTQTIVSREMDRLVAQEKPIGQVVSIQVLSRGVSGRVNVVRVVGTEGELVVQREWPIRKLFGNLKSGTFEVFIQTNQEQMPESFRFVGGGWGHGVGMCQIGAIGMAEHGYDYRQILAHYYNRARVFRLYAGPGESQVEPAVPVVNSQGEAQVPKASTGP